MSQKNTLTLGGKTFNELMEIVNGPDADAFVSALIAGGDADVRPIGDNGENSGNIMIASDPIKAFTETAGSNTADALAAKFVQNNSVTADSPREMVAKRTGFVGGRFDNITTRNTTLQKMLSDVEVSFRGHVEDSQPKFATVDVRDRGIGVSIDDIQNTLLGLGGGSKTFKMWYSGKFGQGGKAPLAHANPNGTVCQIIATRKAGTNEVVFTFIVRDDRSGRARTPIWNYLVNPETQKPWTFKIGSQCSFDEGTLVRSFEYPLGRKGCGKFSSKNGSIKTVIRRTLPDPLNPVSFYDRRTAPKSNRSWRRYLNGKNAKFNHLGSLHDLYNDSEVKLFKEYRLDLGVNSTATMQVFVFKYETDVDHLDQYADYEKPFLMSLNGQTHGELSKHVLTRDVGYTALNRRFYAFVDVDNVTLAMKNKLFASTRESTMLTDELKMLQGKIIKALASDPDLERLNTEYRDHNSAQTNETEDDLVTKLLNEHIRSEKTDNPDGSRRQKPETDTDPTPTPITLPIPVNDPPTLFELRGSEMRDVTKGKTFRVRVDTDAHPDLFEDLGKTFLVDVPYGYLTYESCTRNDGGRKTFIFSVSPYAPSNVTGTITLMVDPPNGSPLTVEVDVNVVDPEPAKPEDEGLPFEVQCVDTPEFLEALEMLRDDVSVLKVVGPKKVVYINLLNPLFQNRIETLNDDGRFKNPEEVVTRYRALYRSNAIVSAWEVFVDNEDNRDDVDVLERLIRCGSKSSFSTLRRTVNTAEDFRRLTN